MVANLYESMQSRGCQECCQYRQGLLTALASIHGVDMDYGVLHITYQSLKQISILDVCVLMDVDHIMKVMDADCTHYGCQGCSPCTYGYVMDAQCTHYGCYERNWSPREKCVCSHWDQGFVVTLPTHRAHTAVECWSHGARY